MGAVTTLRRTAAGAQPPQSEARQKLAQAIAAKATADDRLRMLEAAQGRARAAWTAADDALAKARAAAEEAAGQAHMHKVAELLGQPAPATQTRQQAAAALRAAEEAADDLQRASRAIASEIDGLTDRMRDMADRIDRAAAEVFAEELGTTAADLIAEINRLQGALIDKGRALHWLSLQGGIRLFDQAMTGASEARMALAFPPDQTRLWTMPGASPTADRFAAALNALRQDADAELPR